MEYSMQMLNNGQKFIISNKSEKATVFTELSKDRQIIKVKCLSGKITSGITNYLSNYINSHKRELSITRCEIMDNVQYIQIEN